MKKFSTLLIGLVKKSKHYLAYTTSTTDVIPPAVWSKNHTYQPGDLIITSNKLLLECREAPFGDFCNLDPSSRGGSIAWGPKSDSDKT